MATIVEEVTTTEEVEFETPVYRKIGDELFVKIFSANKMLQVCTTEGQEYEIINPFPSSRVRRISSTEASDEAEFEAAVATVRAAIDLIVTPA